MSSSVSSKDMANALRALSMDAVQAANSGHPGMPMGMADVATALYTHALKFDPARPDWPDRDRFVLSAGHGSMLLYALNHLTGYKEMTLEQLKNFRQLGYHTAGHPEVDLDLGIECTTGPLGQGIAMAVGMAAAETMMQARFGEELVDHFTWCIASDGDLMEGISHEAASLAGHWGLGKLVVLYDDNGICIDGPTSTSFSEDTKGRFEAYGWDVDQVDGHDQTAIKAALDRARRSTDKPTLICCKTVIGYGSPNKSNSASSHGSPLGEDEIKLAREQLGWPHGPFDIPAEIRAAWEDAGKRSRATRQSWEDRLASAGSEKTAAFVKALKGELDSAQFAAFDEFAKAQAERGVKQATRVSSGDAVEKALELVPELAGGSADLTGSNNTRAPGMKPYGKTDRDGRYFHFGVREHGMAAICNGMALHRGVIPYCGTFLTFSDYCRPSIRLAALMKVQSIFVMTHDSIGLGEDGPTHQPVEHLAALRAIPNCQVLRPADAVETADCWKMALEKTDGPTVLSLTRQGLPPLRETADGRLSEKGAYILRDAIEPKAVIVASGSETHLACEAADALSADGIAARVISAPDMTRGNPSDLIPDGAVVVAVEAAIQQGWERWTGRDGVFIGMSGFGASAPAPELYDHFGITRDAIVQAVKSRLG
ncbi:MAG: transketolase [Alphaproteobacteria bacterium]